MNSELIGAAACWPSAGIVRALVCPGGTLLLGLSKAEACFRLLVVPLELAQPCGAGGLLSVGLCSVQLVALAGVISLRSQIVQVFDRHALAVFRGSCAPLGRREVSAGRVGVRSRCWV